LFFIFSEVDCRKMRLLRLILHFAVNEQFQEYLKPQLSPTRTTTGLVS
jgi:hypothetical protein